MTTETTDAGSISAAGIEMTAPAPVMSDIRATAGELLQHVEDVALSTGHSTWLDNARSALASAVQYIESHFAAFEAKAKAEVEKIETVFTHEAHEAVEMAKSEVSDIETKAQANAAVVASGAAAIASNGI